MALKFEIRVDDQGHVAIDRLGKSAGGVDSVMKKLGLTMAGIFTVGKIIAFGKECVASFDKSELAATKLRTAIGGTSTALLAQAAALQKVTRFGDDQTVEAQALLATYGLTEKQILKLIPALLDFSAATGSDLSEAADKAGRSITTSTNAMKRQGIEIADSTSKGERLDSLLQSLEKRFQGQAEAAGMAGSGGLARLGNKYDDLKENIGRCILNFPPFTAAVETANRVLDVATQITGDAGKEYKQFADDIEQKALPAIIDLNKELKVTAQTAAIAEYALVKLPKFGSPEAVREAMKDLKLVTAAADQTSVNIGDSVREINQYLSNIGGKPKGKGDDRIAPTGPAEKTPSELLGMGAIAPNFQKIMQSEMGYGLQLEKVRLDMMKAGQEKEIAQMMQGFEEKHQLILGAGFTEIEYQAMIEGAKTQIVNDNVQKQIRLERELLAAKLGAIGNLVGSLAALNVALKGNANVSKGLAVTSAIINTAVGVTSALAEFNPLIPPWVRIANATAIGIFGAAQVAAISSQKFNAGGPVSGQGNGDTVSAMLTPGEYVLDKRTVKNWGGVDAVDRAVKAGAGGGGMVIVNFNNPIGDRAFFDDYVIPNIKRALSRE